MDYHAFTRGALAAALAAALPPWAAAAPAATELETIVITGIAPESPLTFTTDPKLPRQPLPASDGTDYLKTIPGFSAIRNGGTNGDPVLRGMFGSRLNILANGSALPGACPGRMDAPSSYISPANFDRLTVIKGPQTVLWGPGASAGTVRFERDAPGFTQPGVLFDASLVGGSWGRNDQNADLAVGNAGMYLRVNTNRSHAQDYEDGDGNPVASAWDKWNADVALGLTPDAATLIELSAGAGDGQARYAGRGMDGSKFRRDSVGLRFKKRDLGGVLDAVEAQLYYNDADHVMDNYTLRAFKPGGGMAMPMASNPERITWGGRMAASLNFSPALGLVAGADFQDSRHSGRSGTLMKPYDSQPRIEDASLGNAGLFGELTWRTGAAGRLIGGARADWANAKDFRLTTGGMMPQPNPTANRRRDEVLPSGFVRYEHDFGALPATVYVGLGHVERFPDYWELFSPKRGAAGTLNAFDGVRPEKTTQLDFGVQYRGGKLEAWFAGYAGVINDFILFDYSNPAMSQARNVEARIFGGELGLSWRPAPGWKTGGTLAYAWGENRSEGGALPQIPPLEARLTVGYDDGVWSGGALWRLVAAQGRVALNQGNVVGKDFGPSPGFGVFSLNGGYRVGKRAELAVGIDNLFNKTHAEHLNLAGNAGFGYPANLAVNEPGRTLWARASFRY